MGAKDIEIKFISSKTAAAVVKKYHYSGKVVNNSQLHFGVYYKGLLEGAMQFGPPMVKNNVIGLVKGTTWNGFLELNRMAFSDCLPKNAESRALSVAFRLIKKHYPHIKWIISFADATLCGDGTIYRAAGFHLVGIKRNTSMVKLPDGRISTNMTLGKGKHILKQGGRSGLPAGAKKLPGFQIKYVKILDPTWEDRLTVPKLPYTDIEKFGAAMYKGKTRA